MLARRWYTRFCGSLTVSLQAQSARVLNGGRKRGEAAGRPCGTRQKSLGLLASPYLPAGLLRGRCCLVGQEESLLFFFSKMGGKEGGDERGISMSSDPKERKTPLLSATWNV